MTKQLQGKELAIAVAEKLGENIDTSTTGAFVYENCESEGMVKTEDYLKQKAADILFIEGIARQIDEHLRKEYTSASALNYFPDSYIAVWWAAITPEKILNVWLKL